MARSGTVRLYPGERRAVLELENGAVHSWPAAAPDAGHGDLVRTLGGGDRCRRAFRPRLEREAGQGEGYRRARPRPPASRGRAGPRPAAAAGPGPSDRDPKEVRPGGGLPRLRPPRPAARRHDRAGRPDRGLLARPGRHPLLLCAADRGRERGHGRPRPGLSRHVGAGHPPGRRRRLAPRRSEPRICRPSPLHEPGRRPAPPRRRRPRLPPGRARHGPRRFPVHPATASPACSTGTSRGSSWPCSVSSWRRSPRRPSWSPSSSAWATPWSGASPRASSSATRRPGCPSSWPSSCPSPSSPRPSSRSAS